VDAGKKLCDGRRPNQEKKPKEPAVQGPRPPLSQSLRPARPPEEGERGAGKQPETLKGGCFGWRRRVLFVRPDPGILVDGMKFLVKDFNSVSFINVK
jgi:hypothetical protein